MTSNWKQRERCRNSALSYQKHQPGVPMLDNVPSLLVHDALDVFELLKRRRLSAIRLYTYIWIKSRSHFFEAFAELFPLIFSPGPPGGLEVEMGSGWKIEMPKNSFSTIWLPLCFARVGCVYWSDSSAHLIQSSFHLQVALGAWPLCYNHAISGGLGKIQTWIHHSLPHDIACRQWDETKRLKCLVGQCPAKGTSMLDHQSWFRGCLFPVWTSSFLAQVCLIKGTWWLQWILKEDLTSYRS